MKKHLTYFLMIGVALLIGACESSTVYFPGTRTEATHPGERLFQRGEQLLERNDLNQAIACYSQYLGQYPRGVRADQALSRIGLIYRRQGMNDWSHAFYQKLVNQFPKSPLVNDAQLAMIELLFLKQQPAEAVALGRQLIDANPDDLTRRRLLKILVRQHQDAGEIANAVSYAYMLYQSAPKDEKRLWGEQLKTGISRLKPVSAGLTKRPSLNSGIMWKGIWPAAT